MFIARIPGNHSERGPPDHFKFRKRHPNLTIEAGTVRLSGDTNQDPDPGICRLLPPNVALLSYSRYI